MLPAVFISSAKRTSPPSLNRATNSKCSPKINWSSGSWPPRPSPGTPLSCDPKPICTASKTGPNDAMALHNADDSKHGMKPDNLILVLVLVLDFRLVFRGRGGGRGREREP